MPGRKLLLDTVLTMVAVGQAIDDTPERMCQRHLEQEISTGPSPKYLFDSGCFINRAPAKRVYASHADPSHDLSMMLAVAFDESSERIPSDDLSMMLAARVSMNLAKKNSIS